MSGMTRADGHRDMLSGSSSFIATNCPEAIFPANLAVIGGRADDRTMTALGLSTVMLQLLAALGVAVTSAGNVLHGILQHVVLGSRLGS